MLFNRPGHDNTLTVILKNNTVLQYDSSYKNVTAWGYKAMAQEPSKRRHMSEREYIPKPVEYFKLLLEPSFKRSDKIRIPKNLDYRKAIADYLKEIKSVNNPEKNLLLKNNCIVFYNLLISSLNHS